MIIYHLNLCSKYINTQKLFFGCKCELDNFIDKIKESIPFVDEDAKNKWSKLNSERKEETLDEFFTVTRIDTERCKRWKQLFKAKWHDV